MKICEVVNGQEQCLGQTKMAALQPYGQTTVQIALTRQPQTASDTWKVRFE